MRGTKCQGGYLLFCPKFIKHVLNLQLPVLLQRVKRVLWHLFLHLPLQGCELSEDGAEIRSAVRVLVPALCLTHTNKRYYRGVEYIYIGDSESRNLTRRSR